MQKKVVKHRLQTPGEQPKNLRCGRSIKRKGEENKAKREFRIH